VGFSSLSSCFPTAHSQRKASLVASDSSTPPASNGFECARAMSPPIRHHRLKVFPAPFSPAVSFLCFLVRLRPFFGGHMSPVSQLSTVFSGYELSENS